ncbi:MAG TPA: glycosyltransferase family 4 protein [Burkholderiaceae bacterium]|nr:glycosyltransferase family 4 protein [Burkholderiaceae bacterium]
MRPLRVLMLNMEKGWRGGERQTLLTMQQLRQAGQAVSVLARHDAPLAHRARGEGFDVFEARNALQVCRLLWRYRHDIDIFHAQTANTLTWLAILGPVLKGRLVFTRRTAFPVLRRQSLTRWKWRQAHALVAISEAAASEPRRLGVDVAAIIPSAVSFQPFNESKVAQLREQLQMGNRHVVATAAAMTKEKDPLTLVRTIHRLRQLRNDFIFLHFGAGGDQEAAAVALVTELGLQDIYHFIGFRDDITDCYRLMHVFLLTSRHEALGSSVLDAFLYGVPVVATRAGGLQEVLADGRGMTAATGDVEALAAGVHALLEDPELARRVVAEAATYVAQHHDAGRMTARYLEIYQRLQSA